MRKIVFSNKIIYIAISLIFLFINSCLSQQFQNGGEINVITCDPCGTNGVYADSVTSLTDSAIYVVSDFGPRDIIRTINGAPIRVEYDWHQGIDYSVKASDLDKGYLIESINDGTIYKIGASNLGGDIGEGLKYLVIEGDDGQHYGYVHIFNGDQPIARRKDIEYGNVSFVVLTSHTNSFGIIVNDVLLSDCPTNNCNDYFFVEIGTTDTLRATNEVDAGDVLAVFGDSGAGDAHLHLNYYDELDATWTYSDFINDTEVDHAKDPLTVIEHLSPDYVVQLLRYNNVDHVDNFPLGIEINYNRTTSKSQTILVRPIMEGAVNGNKYGEGVYNVARTELLVKMQGATSYSNIQGPYYTSMIDLGSRIDIPAYPLRINITSRNEVCAYGRFAFGNNSSRTGVFPLAYRDNGADHPFVTSTGGRPWDDYYFSDFDARIHRDDPGDNVAPLGNGNRGTNNPVQYTDHPENARFNDGSYQIYAKVTTVRNQVHNSDTFDFTLDNYVPYIKDIEVNFNNETLGSLHRDANEMLATTAGDGFILSRVINNASEVIPSADLQIIVNVSEPLTAFHLHIDELNLDGIVADSINILRYEFNIPNAAIFDTSDLCLGLRFTGTDVSGNQLFNIENLSEGNDNSTHVILPKRSAAGVGNANWTPTLSDTGLDSFSLCVRSCTAAGQLLDPNSVADRNAANGDDCLDIADLDEVVFHSSSCADSTGAIYITHPDLDISYDIVWYDGDDNPLDYDGQFALQNLPAGKYCYTICGEHCTFGACLVVEGKTNSINLPFYQGGIATCGGIGSITFFESFSGTQPFHYTWTDASGQILYSGDNSSIADLEEGIHTLKVLDGNQCSQSFDFLVFPTNRAKLKNTFIGNNCNNGNDGIIYFDIVSVLDTVNLLNCDIVMTSTNTVTPIVAGPNTYFAENLPSGEYCFTITSQDDGGCILDTCFNIMDGLIDSIEIVSENLVHNCPNQSNGYVDLILSGGVPPFVVNGKTYWEYDFRVNGLDPIDNCLVIEDNCGLVLTRCYELKPLVIEVVTNPACITGGSITLNLSDGNPPYNFLWANGSTSNSISGLPDGSVYCSVGDGNCSYNKTYSIQNNNYEILNTNPACEGLDDGSFTIKIKNYTQSLVHGAILYADPPCSGCDTIGAFSTYDSSYVHTANDLLGNEDYLVNVDIAGGSDNPCNFQIPISVGEVPFEAHYSYFDEIGTDTFICHYDLGCRDNIIEDGEQQLAQFKVEGGDCLSTFGSCPTTTFTCGDEIVGTKHARKQTMHYMEAWHLADYMSLAGPFQKLFTYDLCSSVRICPNDPLCGGYVKKDKTGALKYYEYNYETGCMKVTCAGFLFFQRSYTVCGLGPEDIPESVPDYVKPYFNFNFSLNSFSECKPVKKNIGQLVDFVDDLVDEHGTDFEDSELYNLIIDWSDKPERFCGNVTYCTDDFTILEDQTDQIDDIICGALDNPEYINGIPFTNTCAPYNYNEGGLERMIVICLDDSNCDPDYEYCLKLKYISLEYNDFDLLGLSPEPNNVQLISNTVSNTEFVRFAKVRFNESFVTANGIYESNDEQLYHTFTDTEWKLEETEHMEYWYHDPAASYVFAVLGDNANEANNYTVVSDILDVDPIEQELIATDSLRFTAIHHEESFSIIKGYFNGVLTLDDYTLSESSEESYFILKLDNELNVLSFNSIIAENDIVESSNTNSHDILLQAILPEEHIHLNGENSGAIDLGNVVRLNYETSDLENTEITLTESMQIIDHAKLNDRYYYVTSGKGSFIVNGTVTAEMSTNGLLIICLDANNAPIWKQQLYSANVDFDNVSIELGVNNTLYASVNFDNQVVIPDVATISSTGSTDILILEMGNGFNYSHYGSVDREIIKDLYFDEGILFMGGEIFGETFSREIGSQELIKTDKEQDHAFISYINFTDTVPLRIKATSDQNLNNEKDENYIVFPNPTTKDFNVQFKNIDLVGDYSLNLYSINGKHIYSEKLRINTLSKIHDVKIDMENRNSGVYLLVIIDPKNKKSTLKIVKI